MEDDEEIVKILLMGDTEVGKTALVEKFVCQDTKKSRNRPTSSAYDPDVIIKSVTVDGRKIKAYIHDPRKEGTMGTNNPGLTSSIIYRNVDAVMLVYSVDNSHSLDALQDCWVTEYTTYQRITDTAWVIVGNKNDRPLEVDQQALDDLCSRLPGCVSMFASAATGNNVDEVFHLAIRKAYKKRAQKGTLIRLNSTRPGRISAQVSTDGDKEPKKNSCAC